MWREAERCNRSPLLAGLLAPKVSREVHAGSTDDLSDPAGVPQDDLSQCRRYPRRFGEAARLPGLKEPAALLNAYAVRQPKRHSRYRRCDADLIGSIAWEGEAIAVDSMDVEAISTIAYFQARSGRKQCR